jgi:hypothetical protein
MLGSPREDFAVIMKCDCIFFLSTIRFVFHLLRLLWHFWEFEMEQKSDFGSYKTWSHKYLIIIQDNHLVFNRLGNDLFKIPFPPQMKSIASRNVRDEEGCLFTS